jgi:hypothetical protein
MASWSHAITHTPAAGTDGPARRTRPLAEPAARRGRAAAGRGAGAPCCGWCSAAWSASEGSGRRSALAEDGAILVKFWLHVSSKEQLKRFEARERDPLKRWKLTDEDWRNRKKREAYKAAIEDMVERTSTDWASWHLIEADPKRYARVKVVETVNAAIEDGVRRHGIDPPPGSLGSG